MQNRLCKGTALGEGQHCATVPLHCSSGAVFVSGESDECYEISNTILITKRTHKTFSALFQFSYLTQCYLLV